MTRVIPPEALDLRLEAMAAHKAGDLQCALELYQRIIELDPLADDVLVSASDILSGSGKYEMASQALQMAVQINPQNTVAWYNLGYNGQFFGDPGQSIAALHRALALDPGMYLAWFIMGNLYRQAGQYVEAIEAFKSALRLDDRDAQIWSNLGLAFSEIHRYDEAAAAYMEALKRDFGLVSAHNNLSVLLVQIGQLDGAVQSCERALAIDANNPSALSTMGTILAQRGQHTEAMAYFRRAITAQPSFWKAHSNLLFCALHKDGTTLDEVLALHKEWYAAHGAPIARPDMVFNNERNPNRRLRIGFVSGDFRTHPVGYFVIGTLEKLAAEKTFDLFFYANQHEENDALTQRFRAIAGEHWHNIWNVSARDVMDQIARDKIDVLFDLTGHNDRHRMDIFCMRAAPIQVTWAGYMATTGVADMDWILGDPVQTPLADQPYYVERIHNMPHSFIAYTPPANAPAIHYQPKNFITFSSFNKPTKVTQRTMRLWARVMQELPDSKLLMKFSGLGDPQTSRFFTDYMAALGIAPDRIMFEGFSPHHELLARYNEVDIALDTLPYTGSTTTLEALWMGTPLVTLPGEIFPARHAASYLTAIVAPELIATDENDYVEKIIALARDPARLAHYKQSLRAQMAASPLCNQDLFTPSFAAAVQEIWRGYCET